MKKSLLFLLMFVVLITSCKQQSTEIEPIRTTYEKYKTAILQDNGEEAVNYVDSRTIKHYTEILEKVKTADEATVNSLSFLDKLTILRIRISTKKEEIMSFDGKSLFAFAVKNGMVGKDGVSNQSLGEITNEGDFAKGQMLFKGQKTPIYINFYKENNQWKIDLTSLFPTSTIVFKKLVEESGFTENEYLFELLEAVSNKKVGKEIWIPTEKLKP